MYTKLMQTGAFLVFALLWTPIAYSVESIYPDRSVDVRILGTVPPNQAEPREGPITMKVFVEGIPWLLRIGKIEEQTMKEKSEPLTRVS